MREAPHIRLKPLKPLNPKGQAIQSSLPGFLRAFGRPVGLLRNTSAAHFGWLFGLWVLFLMLEVSGLGLEGYGFWFGAWGLGFRV